MGEMRPAPPVLPVCGLLYAVPEIACQARTALEHRLGPVALTSDPQPFNHTRYYAQEMGPELWRRFLVFQREIDPGTLAALKVETGQLEVALAVEREGRLARRVNLDPGYLTPTRLVLASTKDAPHRVYLGQGIYAEVTLYFTRRGAVPLPWTYGDYRDERNARFFWEARQQWLACRRAQRQEIASSFRSGPKMSRVSPS